MKIILNNLVPLLLFLSVFSFTVSAKEQQDNKAYKKEKEKEGDAADKALKQDLERLNRGTKIDLNEPGDPPPPSRLERGGNGRGNSRVVFFVSPPLENGEHEIVVPLRRDDDGEWGGVNNPFTNIDLSAGQRPGIRIEDAAFIEGPKDRPVGCFFMALFTGTRSIPRPIFYGEFIQNSLPQVTAIICSSVAYERYKDDERYNLPGGEEEN